MSIYIQTRTSPHPQIRNHDLFSTMLQLMPLKESEWESAKSKFDAELQKQGAKRLNVNLPISLHRRFKVKTAMQGETMSDVVLRLIWEYVKEF